eukprot:363299-Chlamydomonas_euryale.AAC.8
MARRTVARAMLRSAGLAHGSVKGGNGETRKGKRKRKDPGRPLTNNQYAAKMCERGEWGDQEGEEEKEKERPRSPAH